MNTPICDFVQEYVKSNTLRLHMPGHKGKKILGAEDCDITEIPGADSLYEASGIIRESELNASTLFGCTSFYSTEGSSLCIRAMLYLTLLQAKQHKQKPLIAAARNVHKSFISAAALLGLDVLWLYPPQQESYLSCQIDCQTLDTMLNTAAEKPAAVYLTSPDYLGNRLELSSLAAVCHRHGVLLLVDNAHGAYLKFLPQSQHPIDLGADMCCDSAHKTLPVLTGGAYLHISAQAPPLFAQQAKTALALFASTSPSYLILQSLDAANKYVAEDYPSRLAAFIFALDKAKEQLREHGYILCGDEPLKLTISTKSYGYSGSCFAQLLQQKNIICEFADPDFAVMMLTPELGTDGIKQLITALLSIPPRAAIEIKPPPFHPLEQVMSIREACLCANEVIPASQSCGRILAAATVSCPPAVPIVVCGERIDSFAQSCFAYYGINSCTVVK